MASTTSVVVSLDRNAQGALDRLVTEVISLSKIIERANGSMEYIFTSDSPVPIKSVNPTGVCVDTNCHTEETLFKVVEAIEELGFKDDQAKQIINALQNKGILFRERLDGDLDG